MQAKRRRIIEDSSLLKDSIEKLMDQAEKEQNLHHVTKANSFKRTIKEMELETQCRVGSNSTAEKTKTLI